MDIDIQIISCGQSIKLNEFTIFGDMIGGLAAKIIWVLRKLLYRCYSIMQNHLVP